MRQAAEAVPPSPWWVAVVLVAIPVVGTVLAARAPVWLERVKQRSKPAVEAPSTPPAPEAAGKRADAALDLVEKSLQDAWSARDTAIRRAERLQAQLDDEQDKNARLLVELTELRARHAQRSRRSPHGDR